MATETTKTGLPQLDPSVIPSQLFWLVVSFLVLYLFFSRVFIPKISSVIEGRKSIVANNLDLAERANERAEKASRRDF